MCKLKSFLGAIFLTFVLTVSSVFAGPIVIKLAHPNIPSTPNGTRV